MTPLREAAQQALEAWDTRAGIDTASRAFEALRAALAQEQAVIADMRSAVRWAPSSAYWSERLREFFGPDAREGIDALERRLAEAQQAEPVEPVAWMCSSPELMAKGYKRFSFRCEGDWNIPVYTAPPPPQRKPLTDEEIRRICDAHWSLRQLARAIERAHGIGVQS